MNDIFTPKYPVLPLRDIVVFPHMIVPLFVDAMPRALFAVLSFLTVMAAVLARFVAQPKMHDGDK